VIACLIDDFRLLIKAITQEALMIFNVLIPSLHQVLVLECGKLGPDLRADSDASRLA